MFWTKIHLQPDGHAFDKNVTCKSSMILHNFDPGSIFIFDSESLYFPCSCAAQLAELTKYFFTKICDVMGEGGHLQQRG